MENTPDASLQARFGKDERFNVCDTLHDAYVWGGAIKACMPQWTSAFL